MLVDARRRRGGDDGLAPEGLALVAEMELAVLDPRVVGPELLERVLDLEQVREVAGGVDPDLEVDGLVLMVEDRQLLVEAVAHGPLADDRQLGVDVDRAGPGHEEEARLEVLEVVDRERVELLPVDRQHPAREEPRVEREESRRFGRRRLDVTALVADDEGVAVEDPDDLVQPSSAPPPADGSRRRGRSFARSAPGRVAGTGRAAPGRLPAGAGRAAWRPWRWLARAPGPRTAPHRLGRRNRPVRHARDTVTAPRRSSTRQCSTCPSRSRSMRRLPVVRPSIGSWSP